MNWQIATLVVGLAGPVITVIIVLSSNSRRGGRVEEAIRGMGHSFDNHREVNAADHQRFDRELREIRRSMPKNGNQAGNLATK